ncbi:MAG TPA: hemolysin family protein [Thermoanaerobaculia bacterium]
MTQRMTLEIVVILGLVLANGAFAMSEIALVSAKKGRLQNLARRGNSRAAVALRLAESPDRFLATVQIGITLIGVFAGAFGGVTIAGTITDRISANPTLAPYAGAIGMAIVVIGITYLSLILGELVPKRIALNHPERISILVAPPMVLISRLGAPLVALLTGSTRAVLKLLRVRDSQEPPVTEEELKSLLWLGTKAGTIEREEREIIERAFRLGERRIKSVMTPRVDLEWLDASAPIADLRERVAASTHDWFPVASGRIDHIAGVVRGRSILSKPLMDDVEFAAVIREPLFVPETASAFSVLQRFRDTRNHVAIVVDEFGGIEGLVTPTDILEALVGELPEISDFDEPMIVELEDGSLSVDATTDLDEVKLILGIEFLEGQRDAFQTVAGYIADHFDPSPRIGQSFVAGNVMFEIVDTDGRRMDRIRVRRIAEAEP